LVHGVDLPEPIFMIPAFHPLGGGARVYTFLKKILFTSWSGSGLDAPPPPPKIRSVSSMGRDAGLAIRCWVVES
jgi:hypothetical protein